MRGTELENHQKPMKEIVKRLETEYSFPLSEADALELFSREGDWQTISYASHVKTLEAWEVDPKFYENLKRNLPYAEIKITDTWMEIKRTQKKYDFIVADAPQGTYGENGEHCEHFGLLSDIFHIANDECVIILNVNIRPYGLQEKPDWMKRRKEYYRTDNPEKLEFESVTQRYKEICKENGVLLEWSFFQQRHVDFLYYFVMKIQRLKA